MCKKCADGAPEAHAEEPAERLPRGVVRVHPRVTMTDPESGLVGQPHTGWTGEKYLHYAAVIVDGLNAGCWDRCTLPLKDNGEPDYDHPFRCYSGAVHLLGYPQGADVYDLFAGLNSNGSPWHKKSWFRKQIGRWAEHIPAPSKQHPGMVAYYQTPQKRLAGIRTPIKPGKYLKKYFGDVLSEEEIQTYGIEWQQAFSPAELKVTQDADEIEQVYENGPRSCMAGSADGFAGDCHPARVYAGPDLGIAYCGDTDEATARCLVWPQKKVYYPKWYGDYHRLEMALEAAGWKAGNEEDFRGARIQRIYNEDDDFYTVPYVDTHSYATDDGTYLILGRGDVYLRHTNGTSDDNPRSGCRCADCERRMREGDSIYVDSTDEYVCESCYSENYFTCEILDRVYPDSDMVAAPDGHRISERATERYAGSRVFFCDGTNMWYPLADYDYVILADGTSYEQSYADENAFQCEFSEEWYDNEERGELDDGRVFAWEATRYLTEQFWDWKDGAIEIGRIDHPRQLELDLALAA